MSTLFINFFKKNKGTPKDAQMKGENNRLLRPYFVMNAENPARFKSAKSFSALALFLKAPTCTR